MKVPFLDLGADYARIDDEVAARFERVLQSQAFVLGEQTEELERGLCALTGAEHAVACSSGTDALYLALRGLGIGTGDAVVVPALSFIATAGAVVLAGALPVFADVDALTLNLGEAELAAVLDREFVEDGGGRVHRRTGARLRAVVVVHLYGLAAGMAGLAAVAAGTDTAIVEDAAQAIGARGDRAHVGSWGAAGCFSFYPTKNLGGAGDGGLVTTGDADVAARVRRLRVHGAEPGAYVHHEVGVNARMGELQAAFLNAKLRLLSEWTEARMRIADAYRERLRPLADAESLSLPPDCEPGRHVYHQFVVRIRGDRDAVARRLADHGVDTRVFYPVPLHLQPCFIDLGYSRGDLPVAERAVAELLALPIYPSLADDQVGAVCERLSAALA